MSMDWINHLVFTSLQIAVVMVVGLNLIKHSRDTSSQAQYWILVILGLAPVAVLVCKSVLPEIPLALLPASWVEIGQVSVYSESLYSLTFLWLMAIYIAVLAYRLMHFFRGLFHIMSLTWRAQPVDDDPAVREVLQQLRSYCPITRHVQLKMSSEVDGPMTWGAWRPIVILPTEFRSWQTATLERFLLHEYQHIKRFDWLLAMVFDLIGHMLWFIPGLGACRKRLAWVAELSCDDFVLACRHQRTHYAADLLSLACTLRKRPISALHVLDGSDVFLRIAHVLEPAKVPANDLLRAWLFAVVFVGLIVPFSCLKLEQWQHTHVPVHYPNQIDRQQLYLFSEDANIGKQR